MAVDWRKYLKEPVILNYIQREADDLRLAFCAQE